MGGGGEVLVEVFPRNQPQQHHLRLGQGMLGIAC